MRVRRSRSRATLLQPLEVGEEGVLSTVVPRQQPRGFAPDVRAPEEGFQFRSRRLGVGVPEGRRPRSQDSVYQSPKYMPYRSRYREKHY